MLTRPLVSLLASIAALVVTTHAQSPAPKADGSAREITADFTREAGPTDKMYQVCVGAGRVNEGLRAEWQKQLAYVHRTCGFTYLRMHGLFTDDMRVYQEDKQGHPAYNWQYVDMVYDYLLQIGMKPFVELGFMPDDLASGKQTCFWWHGNVTPPKDWTKWENLIRATVEHWRQRYGDDELKTWYFEVWNEPNLHYFFAGTQADYFKLYEVTCRAIKSVNPAYRVGGPATAGCAWVPEFIAFCTQNHVPVDFITTHTYGVDEGYVDENGNKGTILSPSPESISGDVHRVRDQIAHSARPDLPLHMTEWSTSYTPFDPVHDSYQSAAFIIDRIRKVGSAAQSLSYWVFTDIFEEPGPRMTPFHGGFGLVNYQEINKPSFYAFEYLHKLGATELQCSDRSAWVTKDAQGGVQALVWNYTYPGPGKGNGVNNQVYFTRDLPPKGSIPVTVTIAHVPAGRYALSVYRVGYRVNDAYTTYHDLGSPSQLTRAQVAYIKSVNSGAPAEQRLVEIGADGTFRQDETIRDNDVCLVVLKPM
ncbi:MAG TPA: hypothetical protein VHE61_13075 [Opitutaceae bacterium]|nr:hypothetical protein [Opitutaceae bacterium]